MNKIADNIEKNIDELATIESIDNGKSFGMAKHDIGLGLSVFRYFAGYPDKIHGKTLPMNGPYQAVSQKVPIGVVG